MSKTDAPNDPKLDAWLSDWPAPERSEDAWENFGSKLEERIAGLTVGQGEDDWFDAPLPPEPGEGTSNNAKLDAGGASMSEPESDKPKKKSLKDFAQRVSVAPPSPTGDKATGTPLPKATETPVPVSGPRASSPSLRASSPSLVSRPPEARDSDSGIVDLNAVRKSAASIPDTGAQPAEVGLLDDDQPVAPKAEPKRSGSIVPIVGGGVVAVLALAAAAVLVIRSPDSAPDMTASEAPAAPMASATATAEMPASPPAKGAAESAGISPESLAAASAAPEPGAEEPDSDEAARARSVADTDDEPAAKSTAKAEDDKSKPEKSEPKGPSDPDDLEGAMADAVGAEEKDKDDATKKAAGAGIDPGAIPESPSQGAIQGALGSVKGAAKACVAGLDGPSRATITFSSNGSVSSVSVSGAASGTPAAGCIQSALRGARVGPFKRSSFTVGMTIRP